MEAIKHIVYIVLVFVLWANLGMAQQSDFVFGQLVDKVQNEPIPFASITIKDKGLGVISNYDGTFKVPMRFKELGEVLEISCMGYQSKAIVIDDLLKDQSNVIFLKPEIFTLNEAVVSANIKKLSADQIVKIAVKSIPQNYPINTFGLVGYYRDYQVKNAKYTNLNEAIIEIEDKGFNARDNFGNHYQLYSYDKNPDFEVDTFAKQPYDYEDFNKVIPKATLENKGGNEFITLIVHDAIRNYKRESFSFINDMETDFLDTHQFRLQGKTNYKGQAVYEVVCDYQNDSYLAEGKIFINAESFAIHKLDYAVYFRKKPNDRSAAVNAQERYSDGFERMNSELLYRIQMEYARGQDEKMFLNYISFYNKVLVHRPAKFASKFVVELRDKTFRIRLNKFPDKLAKIKNGDFKVFYKNERLPIEEFYFLEDERTFVVCPHLGYEETRRLFDQIFNMNDTREIPDLTYGYNDIKDDLGNALDERKYEYVHQYREFFTQKILPNTTDKIEPDNLMIPTLPLESAEQPVNAKELKNEYWKNTPLPTFTN